MDFGKGTQIFFLIVTLRVTKTIEHEKDINLKKASEPDINTNSYVNQDHILILKDDKPVDSVYTEHANISSDGQKAAINETNVQLQSQSSSFTTSNKTEVNETKNVTENSIKEDKVKSRNKETNCETGYCKKQSDEAEEKTTPKKHNFKNRDRKYGEKWNPPRKYIGPEKEPADNTIDHLYMGPEEQYNLQCDAFRKSRFNPYSMLNEKLFAFYIWGPLLMEKTIEFTVPSSQIFNYIKKKVDSVVDNPVNWNNRFIMMIDQTINFTAVLVEHNSNGRYCVYPFVKKATGMRFKHDLHVQFKQSADGKYLLMVMCDTKVASGYLFSRFKDIPRKNEISSVTAMMGVYGHQGKSYLYQGHQWFPVKEMDELEYWALEYGRTRPEAVPERLRSPDQEFEDLLEPLPDEPTLPKFVPFKVEF